ncbi:TIGR00730 family Rossman fold protein [Actinocorallia sp. A-T 12471]|uniref:LOG family protein n=1 Tax=Actinocorallia sp. A-T 12471 TaxID=3089813 RepID=UPI0029D3B371|nr:TIGR00730 family Rossman fold protein [Actinocorallia sp. A-T 12471]MDX6738779.1 TIGR00730 family Rossman fold protein [Actinocorallia sp. A-T 12471]
MTVTVFCASSTRIDGKHVEVAREVGAELARRGHTLVTGGGVQSCMGSVAEAARLGGARTVGVVPEGMPAAQEVADGDNDELVIVPDMRARKAEMDRRADGFLVLPGGIGTLEELLEIWVARSLGFHAKPIVILDPHGVYGPLHDLMDHLLEEGFNRPAAAEAVRFCGDVGEALDHLEAEHGRRAEELLEF